MKKEIFIIINILLTFLTSISFAEEAIKPKIIPSKATLKNITKEIQEKKRNLKQSKKTKKRFSIQLNY
ncbi:hypothetical protein DBT_0522 [Dissulfuribacter thermophilus]|uniref:Uncharacterized protein n=1 Tax=Dissulfuribacter thermophilus TaxID=1156395 RepID=A0A1B9F832_9BACT|nr:hypothetical protein DBT_0522 [Dissulfuribacter thermophilus]